MPHVPFHYNTSQEVLDEAHMLGLDLPWSEDLTILQTPCSFYSHRLPNRIAIQPMEGCDGTADGAPDTLTQRRYQRFAESGASLIWMEAVSIMKEGRANPRQLYIHKDNIDAFKALLDGIRETSLKRNGYVPLLVMQATHSGRYAKPNGVPEPMIAYNNPIFEANVPIDPSRIVTDDYLDRLGDLFGEAALLAAKAGFDGIDIKCCHRYLLSELCSAYERPGRYGGSFENRTRLLKDGIRNAMSAAGDRLFVTSRLNLYDGFPYPNGFGVKPDGTTEPDLAESIQLVADLKDLGVEMIDATIGNPYFNPHVNRPYDKGGYVPPEHPLVGVARMMHCIGTVSAANPDVSFISSANSYLRQFAPYLAAGAIQNGITTMAGFGREAFAYPDFIHDVFEKGAMDPKKCCVTCGKCTELMRAGSVAGCVVRDTEVYVPLYRRDVLKK